MDVYEYFCKYTFFVVVNSPVDNLDFLVDSMHDMFESNIHRLRN